MDLLRKLIIERIRMGVSSDHWLLDVYYHLIGHGASSEAAIKAMDLFVDDVIAAKTRRMEHVE